MTLTYNLEESKSSMRVHGGANSSSKLGDKLVVLGHLGDGF